MSAAPAAVRRAALIAESGRLRAELAHEGSALAGRYRTADRLVAAARSGPVRAALLGGAAFALLGKPRRALRTLRRLLLLWTVLRPVLPRLTGYLRRR